MPVDLYQRRGNSFCDSEKGRDVTYCGLRGSGYGSRHRGANHLTFRRCWRLPGWCYNIARVGLLRWFGSPSRRLVVTRLLVGTRWLVISCRLIVAILLLETGTWWFIVTGWLVVAATRLQFTGIRWLEGAALWLVGAALWLVGAGLWLVGDTRLLGAATRAG